MASREVDLCSKGLEDPRWGLGSLKPGLSFKIRCLHVLVSFAMRTHCLCSTFGLRVVFWDSACDTVVCRHLRNLLLRALIPLMSVLGVIGEAFRPVARLRRDSDPRSWAERPRRSGRGVDSEGDETPHDMEVSE